MAESSKVQPTLRKKRKRTNTERFSMHDVQRTSPQKGAFFVIFVETTGHHVGQMNCTAESSKVQGATNWRRERALATRPLAKIGTTLKALISDHLTSKQKAPMESRQVGPILRLPCMWTSSSPTQIRALLNPPPPK